MVFKISASFVVVAALALISGTASAGSFHKGGRGCGALVTQVHPDLQDKARHEEIEKCKRDPDAYSKAAGL